MLQILLKHQKISIIPRSEKKRIRKALRQSDIVISAGPAGTGKLS